MCVTLQLKIIRQAAFNVTDLPSLELLCRAFSEACEKVELDTANEQLQLIEQAILELSPEELEKQKMIVIQLEAIIAKYHALFIEYKQNISDSEKKILTNVRKIGKYVDK